MKKIIAVYEILHLATGHFYVGSTGNLTQRKNDHFWNLEENKHHNKKLQKLYNQDKAIHIRHRICKTREMAYSEEQFLLDQHLKNPLMLNRSGDAKNNFSFKRTKAHNRNLSNSLKGRVLSDEWKKKLSEAAFRRGVQRND